MSELKRADIPFSDVGDMRGIWMTVGQLEAVLTRADWFMTPLEPGTARYIRDRLLADPAVTREFSDSSDDALDPVRAVPSLPAVLTDLVVFDHVFVDRIAATRWGIRRDDLTQKLGPLASMFRFVDIDDDTYRQAVDVADRFIALDPHRRSGPDLEQAIMDPGEDQTALWDGQLKAVLDARHESNMEQGGFAVPGHFVDSGNTVERLLLYLEIQRRSGAPVRLSPNRVRLLTRRHRIVPVSTLEQIRNRDPQGHVEQHVANILFRKHELDAPPVFDILMRELGGGAGRRSLADIVQEVRSWDQTRRYRDWLWQYHRAVAERRPLVQERLQRQLDAHLAGFADAGDGRTYRTRRIKFAVAVSLFSFLGFEIPAEPRVPRWIDDDYVGFIGEWFEPDPRRAQGR